MGHQINIESNEPLNQINIESNEPLNQENKVDEIDSSFLSSKSESMSNKRTIHTNLFDGDDEDDYNDDSILNYLVGGCGGGGGENEDIDDQHEEEKDQGVKMRMSYNFN
ncbi:hypothetical protein V6N11_058936 [Hibiscus sabdariffa]|uniref:Uncharacterized protein n=1 Tax=Hibiscus sabdariffa TaxID=183260 RepID=A0ABR2U5R4_9ROSI